MVAIARGCQVTGTEYQIWLETLTPEQRSAVQTAVSVVMDSLVMLEGRMAKSEAEIKLMNKRITKLERYLCFPERDTS